MRIKWIIMYKALCIMLCTVHNMASYTWKLLRIDLSLSAQTHTKPVNYVWCWVCGLSWSRWSFHSTCGYQITMLNTLKVYNYIYPFSSIKWKDKSVPGHCHRSNIFIMITAPQVRQRGSEAGPPQQCWQAHLGKSLGSTHTLAVSKSIFNWQDAKQLHKYWIL